MTIIAAPPDLHRLCIWARARGRSPGGRLVSSLPTETTASNVRFSTWSSARTSHAISSTSGSRVRARSSIAGEPSTPVTRQPSSCAAWAVMPLPQVQSSSVRPLGSGRCPANSLRMRSTASSQSG